MKVMLLAAGRGERMRPLTDATPKPLLKAGPRTLIEHHLHALASAGHRDIVINVAWLGEQIQRHVGDGSRYGASVTYSEEPYPPLETAGGIVQALPLLGEAPFAVINADIWTDYPFERLPLHIEGLAHLILVDNPEHHRQGDFALANHIVLSEGETRYTYSGMGVYHPRMFASLTPGRRPLAPLLREAMQQRQVTGEHYAGRWRDIGTPERLTELDAQLSAKGQ